MMNFVLDCLHLRNPVVKKVTAEERWQISHGPQKDDFQAINNARFTKAAAVTNAIATTLTGATSIIAVVNAKQPSPKVMINGQAYDVEGGSAPGSTVTSAALGIFSGTFALASVYYGLKLAYPSHPVKMLRSWRSDGLGPDAALRYRDNDGKLIFVMPGVEPPAGARPQDQPQVPAPQTDQTRKPKEIPFQPESQASASRAGASQGTVVMGKWVQKRPGTLDIEQDYLKPEFV